MIPAIAVLFAGLLHAVWNAMAKAVPDRYAGMALMGLVQSGVCVPLLFVAEAPSAAAWPYIAGSIVIHVFYVLLLIRCYELGDFGQVYPMARGSAPLMVAIAALFFGEVLTFSQALGLLAVCGGLIALALAGKQSVPSRPAVVAALLTGLSIASYTVVDGVGVRESGTSLGYTAWMFAIEGVVIFGALLVLRGRTMLAGMGLGWRMSASGGVISMLAYGIVLWAQTRSQLAEVAALRETGVLWGAVIGVVFFSEKMGPRRIVAAGVVTLGVVLLNAH